MSDKTRDLSIELKRKDVGPYKLQAFWDPANKEVVVTQSHWVQDGEDDVAHEWGIVQVYDKPFDFISSTLFA